MTSKFKEEKTFINQIILFIKVINKNTLCKILNLTSDLVFSNSLSWFNPSQQLGPTQPLTHSSWDGGDYQKSENEKTCGLR